jgi:hypothetical protein
MVTMSNFANAIAVFEKYFKEYDLSLQDNMSIGKGKLHIYLTPSLINDEDRGILRKGGFLWEGSSWSYIEWINAIDDDEDEEEE